MTKRITIKFEPMGRSVTAEPHETVMAAAARENLPVRSDCGGNGTCGKCRVILEPAGNASPPNEAERKTLSAGELGENLRLACQAQVLGPLTVTIPEQFMDTDIATGKRLAVADYAVDPMVRRFFISSDLLSAEENSQEDRMARVTRRLSEEIGKHHGTLPPGPLDQIATPALRKTGATVVLHKTLGITAVIPGEAPRSLGLAVDIGTTSVAAYLCDMETGQVLASDSAANPQRRFGEDVISRIAFAEKDPGNTDILQRLVVKTVSDLAERCTRHGAVSPAEIDEVTVVGNPTMAHLFCGTHPGSLGRAPFMPRTREPVRLRAADAGLALNPGTPVYIFPLVSGFVGGDTLGAVLADSTHRRDETTLLVDIGTNGELVMGNREGLWATSCATGPAFEGAQISCGMRAVPGAITRVNVDASGSFSWEVMNGIKTVKPMGLCGSGIIDAIAALRQAGNLLESGSFQKEMPGVTYDDQGIGREFALVPKEASGTGLPITITLGDIRQIQLAKAALALGIEFLAHHAGREVERIVLTGAFGARFDWRNAFAVGMLPSCVAHARVEPMNNLAGVGAIRALLDGESRSEVEKLYGAIRHVDLSKEKGFHTGLVKHMSFPNLDKK